MVLLGGEATSWKLGGLPGRGKPTPPGTQKPSLFPFQQGLPSPGPRPGKEPQEVEKRSRPSSGTLVHSSGFTAYWRSAPFSWIFRPAPGLALPASVQLYFYSRGDGWQKHWKRHKHLKAGYQLFCWESRIDHELTTKRSSEKSQNTWADKGPGMLNEQKKQTANPNLQTQVLKCGGRDKKIRM